MGCCCARTSTNSHSHPPPAVPATLHSQPGLMRAPPQPKPPPVSNHTQPRPAATDRNLPRTAANLSNSVHLTSNNAFFSIGQPASNPEPPQSLSSPPHQSQFQTPTTHRVPHNTPNQNNLTPPVNQNVSIRPPITISPTSPQLYEVTTTLNAIIVDFDFEAAHVASPSNSPAASPARHLVLTDAPSLHESHNTSAPPFAMPLDYQSTTPEQSVQREIARPSPNSTVQYSAYTGGFSNQFSQWVVADLGSAVCKAGLHTSDQPTVCFSSVIGDLRPSTSRTATSFTTSTYVGHAAVERRGILSISSPIRAGLVNDWNGFELLLDSMFTELQIYQPNTFPLILPLGPRMWNAPMLDKIQQILFERFQIPLLCLPPATLAALYSTGCNTGVVLDVGAQTTTCQAFVDGETVGGPIQTDVGGEHVTATLKHLLQHAPVLSGRIDEFGTSYFVQQIKEMACYVCQEDSSDNLVQKRMLDEFQLPDGEMLSLSTQERTLPPEILFNPSGKLYQSILGIGHTHMAAHEALGSCVQSVEQAKRGLLYSGIVVSGGSANMTGFSERLGMELSQSNTVYQVRIVNGHDEGTSPGNATWRGASALINSGTLLPYCIQRSQWLDGCPLTIH